MGKGCLIAGTATATLLAGGCYLLATSLFPSPIPAPGWKCDAGQIHCTAENGNWQGLRIGMSHEEALQAFCALLKRGVLPNPNPGENTMLPAHLDGGRCKPEASELTLKPADADARPEGLHFWTFDPPDMWCSLHSSHQHVWIDFDRELRIKRIQSYCSQSFI